MFRPMLTILALPVAAVACGPLPQPLATQPSMAQSATCKVDGQNTWGRPSSTPLASMQMNNDGGWCWMESSEYLRGRQVGPFLRVTV